MKRKFETASDAASKSVKPDEEYWEMLEQGILDLVARRGKTKSCWPSEITKIHLKLANWKGLCPEVRKIAIELAKDGRIKILQKGKIIGNDMIDNLKGPIRLSQIW